MSSSKTILKRTSRKRGSVSLTRVRQAVATVLAQNSAGRNTCSASKVQRAGNSSRPVRIAHTN